MPAYQQPSRATDKRSARAQRPRSRASRVASALLASNFSGWAIPVEKAEASPCVLLRGVGKDARLAYDSAGATIKRGKPTGRAANYCLAAVVEAARVGLGTSASCFDPQALTGTLSFGRGSRSATCLGPVSRGCPRSVRANRARSERARKTGSAPGAWRRGACNAALRGRAHGCRPAPTELAACPAPDVQKPDQGGGRASGCYPKCSFEGLLRPGVTRATVIQTRASSASLHS